MEDQIKQTKEEHFDGGKLTKIADPVSTFLFINLIYLYQVFYRESKHMVYPMKYDAKRFTDLQKDGEPAPTTYKAIEAYEKLSPKADRTVFDKAKQVTFTDKIKRLSLSPGPAGQYHVGGKPHDSIKVFGMMGVSPSLKRLRL